MAGASPTGTERPGAVGRYALGVAITVFAILSQYFLPQLVPSLVPIYSSLAGDLFVVYGIPVIAFSILVGAGPLRRWAANGAVAVRDGLGWYGTLSVISLLVFFVSVIAYEAIDPGALQLLSRENPALAQASGDPWFWAGFSFVIGAFEETIFRGWIFGFWRGRTRSAVGPAIGSSLLFAGVHLYYGTTYGAAAPLIFPMLFFLGLAFAATYQTSGGNLVMVALLHGAYDASAFIALVDSSLGLALRYGLILVGLMVALVQYLLGGSGPIAVIAGHLSSGPGPPPVAFPSMAPPPAPPPPPPGT